jgi:NAD(P)-dependent dehydrogenase (short-subunit alcohol dehydrogenase family)
MSRGLNFVRLAVKHMAASLAVEWAKKDVRVNVLRSDCHASVNGAIANLSFSVSPGYMLTKLTKTILAHDPELKVHSELANF